MMVRESCHRPSRLGDANDYLRKKLTHMDILNICYKLNIYKKCYPRTYIMLSPKLRKKNECQEYKGLFDHSLHKGNLELRMPQLRRSNSMILF